MKKTFNINLNSQVFCIDEDACMQLQRYIETLEKYYLKEEDGREIMADIESRIAELFTEFLQKYHKQVISQSEIDRVIEIMGTPDAIIDEDAEQPVRPSRNANHRLYRDKDNAILGGVAAGLAAYFSISVAWIRIAFIVFTIFYGITVIVYIILWIAIPKAVTAKQKLEMKGENINVSNIEKNIRNTYNEVKKNSKLNETLNTAGRKASSFFSVLGEIAGRILSVIAHILAGIALLAGTFAFLAACWGIFFAFHILQDNHYLFLQYVSAPVPLWVLKGILFCFFNIPLFLIVYYSASYLFKFHGQKGLLAISAILWFVACFAGIFLSIYYTSTNGFPYKEQNEFTLTTADTTQKVLNVKFHHPKQAYRPGQNYYSRSCLSSLDKYLLFVTKGEHHDSILYLRPRIRYEKTEQTVPQLVVFKKARGFSEAEAINNINNIHYSHAWRNDTLFIDSFFTLYTPKIRANQMEVIILIPENYQLNLQNPPYLERYDMDIFNDPEKYRNNPAPYQQYRMKGDQLFNISQ